MKKYQQPSIKCEVIAPLQLLDPTGGGTQPGEPIIDPNPDEDDEDPRIKEINQDSWGTLW